MTSEEHPPDRSYRDKMQTDLEKLQNDVESGEETTRPQKKKRRGRGRGHGKTRASASKEKQRDNADDEHEDGSMAK
jgi:hypothetical protein